MSYLGEILRAIHEEKLPIAGAFAWGKNVIPMHTIDVILMSLSFFFFFFCKAMVDNAEWSSGLAAR